MSRNRVAHRTAATAPLSVAICDLVCAAFALWTLCVHAVVALGGSLHGAMLSFAIAGAAAAGVWFALSRRAEADQAPETAVSGGREDPRPAVSTPRRAVLVAVATAVLAVAHTQGLVVLWACVVLLLLAALAFVVLPHSPVAQPPARGRGLEIGLWALGLGAAGIALTAHRVDIDDSFYVNLAVAVADAPSAPLLRYDTLHGVEGLPIHLPVYRFHSYEVFNGVLAYLTRIPALTIFHWVAAGVASLLVSLAHARLFRLLTPRNWLWATVATVFVLLAAGDVHRWYGNFAFVRMWQGKGIFLFVFTPLIYTYAIEFALRPTARRWLLLAAAQIAAVGCSSSAIWAAPAAALLGLACVTRPTRAGLRNFAMGALATTYVLGVGFQVKAEMAAGKPRPAAAVERVIPSDVSASKRASVDERHAPGRQLEVALHQVVGDGRLRLFALASIALAWTLCAPGLAQRFAIVLPLAVTLILLDPWTTRWVTANATGNSYWRALWAMPVPILMALVLIAPIELASRQRRRLAALAATALLLAAFAVFVPRFNGLDSRNGRVQLGFPALKVESSNYRWAAALANSVPPGSQVVAPHRIGVWLSTIHRHPFPLVVRPVYLNRYEAQFGSQDLGDRYFMTAYVGGGARRVGAAKRFRDGLERFSVKGVCLSNDGDARRARKVLRSAGFERTIQDVKYEIWVRS